MRSVPPRQRARRVWSIFFGLLVIFSLALPFSVAAQHAPANSSSAAASTQNDAGNPAFRIERIPVDGGAELLTVFGDLNGVAPNSRASEAPLVSILRDTLGDADPENDRLRHVWMLTYTRPTLKQRLAAGVPFLYMRVGNKKKAVRGVPPAVIDLAQPDKDVWQRFLWMALQNIFVNPYGVTAKSSSRTFQRNTEDYRKVHVIRALAVLSLYEAEADVESVFSPAEMLEIQSRLILTQMTFGGIVDDAFLQKFHQNQATAQLDERGHNWELLRQRAEAEGLLFEPLQLPDGSATHALVWTTRHDVASNRQRRKWDNRFLNISKPWGDKRLDRWDGYTETRFFDAENRAVVSDTPGARAVEMIPLALYGLDNPKIPALLVDFRDGGNPKRREVSRRVLEDVARNILSLSRFGDIHYFLGRTIFDFITSRRGMDVNQPTRLRTYSQLKLLLTLSASLDPEFREEISRRLEHVSLNPLENDLAAEARLARAQHAALMDYARRPDGLARQLDRDRRAELVPLAHGRTARVLFRFGHVLSFGHYTHREKALPETGRTQIDVARRLAHHRRFLREVSKSSPIIEVVWDMSEVRRSLQFVAENGARADGATASVAARIFARTKDEATQRLCLDTLYHINNETAKNALWRIHQDQTVPDPIRTLSAEYLRKAVREEQLISPTDTKAIISAIGQ